MVSLIPELSKRRLLSSSRTFCCALGPSLTNSVPTPTYSVQLHRTMPFGFGVVPYPEDHTAVRADFFKRISTEESAAEAARGWLNNPANRMSLPKNTKEADADGDGLIDKKEFQELFDLDGDGQVSEFEKQKAAKLFALVDKDGDGQLTEEELKQVRPLPPVHSPFTRR